MSWVYTFMHIGRGSPSAPRDNAASLEILIVLCVLAMLSGNRTITAEDVIEHENGERREWMAERQAERQKSKSKQAR